MSRPVRANEVPPSETQVAAAVAAIDHTRPRRAAARLHRQAEQTHRTDQRPDMDRAGDPAVAVGESFQRCRGSAEQRDRMAPSWVAQREVGQVADRQHAAIRVCRRNHLGRARRGLLGAEHPGSVSQGGLLEGMRPARRSAMKRPATRVADLLNPAALLLPAANVIMQLSLPGVGYGVLESPVDSGNVYKHPFKRARTTGTYLAVATIGTESDRALIRAAVDVAHRQVRSTSSSPVSYNAFDPKLQLWVAACLYRYFVDQHEFLHGPLDDASRRCRLSRRQAAGHHAAGARAHVAAGPGRLR